MFHCGKCGKVSNPIPTQSNPNPMYGNTLCPYCGSSVAATTQATVPTSSCPKCGASGTSFTPHSQQRPGYGYCVKCLYVPMTTATQVAQATGPSCPRCNGPALRSAQAGYVSCFVCGQVPTTPDTLRMIPVAEKVETQLAKSCGMNCAIQSCNTFCEYAEPNASGNRFVCYSCRTSGRR